MVGWKSTQTRVSRDNNRQNASYNLFSSNSHIPQRLCWDKLPFGVMIWCCSVSIQNASHVQCIWHMRQTLPIPALTAIRFYCLWEALSEELHTHTRYFIARQTWTLRNLIISLTTYTWVCTIKKHSIAWQWHYMQEGEVWGLCVCVCVRACVWWWWWLILIKLLWQWTLISTLATTYM